MKGPAEKVDSTASSDLPRGRAKRRPELGHPPAERSARRQRGERKRLRRAEARLASARDREKKRARQLEKARVRVKKLEAGVAALRTTADPNGAREVAVQAFCLREKQLVAIVRPVPIVLRNGRGAISGSCPSCGARVVSMARAAGVSTTEA